MKGKKKHFLLYFIFFIIADGLIGFLFQTVMQSLQNLSSGQPFRPDFTQLFRPGTWVIGFAGVMVMLLIYGISHIDRLGKGDIFAVGKNNGDVESVLENSRFMTEKERDFNFASFTYDTAPQTKNDGVPVRAVLDKKGKLQCNFMSGAHSLVIGATGSGKTTTFINPMIQLIGASEKGSSMIMTDPKGELFDMHSAFLVEKGYDVKVLDLRDTYSSSRWNPLGGIWDMYQDYIHAGEGIRAHRDSFSDYPDLKLMDEKPPEEGELWIEWQGKAFSDPSRCQDEVAVAKQKIYDEMYEDLNDFVSVLCPITNEKDPLWEKGARSIILATCLAMLEDSENPELGMTKEKFNFYNINKMLTNSQNEFAELKAYFEGRSQLSQAVTLSRQVLGAAQQTMSSYMSITFDKLNMFNDQGICGLTSATDINASQFAEKPTALFMKIPDEKDTRHGLAAVFILCIYKALIKVASSREDLSLPRNVYFILDEFGNMPKIEKFDKMITVGRSRKIWFNMVVQSYSQLNAVYGEQVADIVKSNCAMKMFIGSNDIGTCKEFSELCGNKTVKTSSTSSNVGAKEGEMSISTQTQVRPLIYPSELQKLNNKESTGNAIIVTFGNYPLMTKYTPSYRCPYYKFGKMDMGEIRSHMFRPDEVFYDTAARNRIVLGENQQS
ncbi:MAG: type IV secretory system conjugative DNA transfer family protein [Clostridiales bacterium]|nr:type IV secretory system conjugative DNA transfer family protein [Clostridiales bacterium]